MTTDNRPVRIEITEAVHSEMLSFFRGHNDGFEHGGIIGSDLRGRIVAFCPDEGSEGLSPRFYCPDTEFLENVINGEWAKKDIRFAGIVHSHPCDNELSSEDIEYLSQILELNNMESLYAAVVTSHLSPCDRWYRVLKDGVAECWVEIL